MRMTKLLWTLTCAYLRSCEGSRAERRRNHETPLGGCAGLARAASEKGEIRLWRT